MVKVTKNENVRIVYRPYLRQEWIGLSRSLIAHIWLDTFQQRKRINFRYLSVCDNRFMLIAQKQSDTFSSSLTHRLCSTHLVVRLPKIGVVAEIFSPEGAEVFNKKFTQPRLQIARCRFLCCILDGYLIQIQRLYREQFICHICTISVRLSPTQHTLLTGVSAQQRPRIADLPPIRQSILVTDRHPFVCLSVP